MPTCLNNLPERVMINEFISEYPEYDWGVEIDSYVDEVKNVRYHLTLHYTADMTSFASDLTVVDLKTKKCSFDLLPLSATLGKYMLAFDKNKQMNEVKEKTLHTAAILRRVNGNTI